MKMEVIHPIKELVDIVNSVGGHIILATCLGLLGVAAEITMTIWLWPNKDLILAVTAIIVPMTQFLAIASYAMSGRGSANGTTTVTSTEVRKTETPAPIPPPAEEK